MSEWTPGQLSDVIASLNAGVSVNSDDRTHGSGEIGVLKTSALSDGVFRPDQHKTVKPEERSRVAEPVRGDSVLLSRMNTPALVGEACYVRDAHPSLFLPDRIWQIEPVSPHAVSMRWLSFVLRSNSFRRHVDNYATGTSGSMKNLPKSTVRDYRLSFPEIAEQGWIARILDTLDTQIEKTQALIAKLEQVKEGLLHDLLTRGVDENGELRPSAEDAPELYKASALGLIPREWEVAPLVSKIRFPTGQVDPKRDPYRSWILVAPDHIESGTGRLLSRVTANEQNAISGKYLFEPNDVIYSKIRPYLRKAVLADFAGLCSADMYPLRPDERTDPRYLLAVVLGGAFSQFAESVSMRSGFPKINRNEMAEFFTGWPPFSEQQAISKIIRSLDARSHATECELQSLRDLKSGLMDDLLTGRVRVTPLLEREPAEAT